MRTRFSRLGLTYRCTLNKHTGSRARRCAAASKTRSTAGRFAPSRVGRFVLGNKLPTRALGFHDSSSGLPFPFLTDFFLSYGLSSSDASSDG